jgi:hypothetical protein
LKALCFLGIGDQAPFHGRLQMTIRERGYGYKHPCGAKRSQHPPGEGHFTAGLHGSDSRGLGPFEEFLQASQVFSGTRKKSHPPVSRRGDLEDDLGSSVRKTAETGLQDAGTV